MAKFQVSWIEILSSSKGGKYAKASLVNDVGVTINDVRIFDKFPNFVSIRAGSTLDGDLSPSVYKGKTNYILNPARTNTLTPPLRKEDPQKRVEKHIDQTIERREMGVKISAVFRDATTLTAEVLSKLTSMGQDWSIEDAQALWVQWRKWLNENFGDNEPPF